MVPPPARRPTVGREQTEGGRGVPPGAGKMAAAADEQTFSTIRFLLETNYSETGEEEIFLLFPYLLNLLELEIQLRGRSSVLNLCQVVKGALSIL